MDFLKSLYNSFSDWCSTESLFFDEAVSSEPKITTLDLQKAMSMEAERFNLSNPFLMNEILQTFLINCNIKNSTTLTLVCKKINQMSSSDDVWKIWTLAKPLDLRLPTVKERFKHNGMEMVKQICLEIEKINIDTKIFNLLDKLMFQKIRSVKYDVGGNITIELYAPLNFKTSQGKLHLPQGIHFYFYNNCKGMFFSNGKSAPYFYQDDLDDESTSFSFFSSKRSTDKKEIWEDIAVDNTNLDNFRMIRREGSSGGTPCISLPNAIEFINSIRPL